jgi:hypothetical protein
MLASTKFQVAYGLYSKNGTIAGGAGRERVER